MTATTSPDPTDVDPAEAARKSAAAGIADESAAYVNAGATDAPAGEHADTADAEAHPS